MKIPSTFKIDLSKRGSCVTGGIMHREITLHDKNSFVNGYRCLDCQAQRTVKVKKHVVKTFL